MSTERSILFNGAMVRAILSGAKTQTRRVLKQATGPSLSVDMVEGAPGVAELSWLHGAGAGHEVEEGTEQVRCPFGKPGDRLWVRETWKTHSTFDHLSPREVPPRSNIFYAADDRYSPSAARWRPSIHMPRGACRLMLEITGVRVERLQAISAADALAEGIEEISGRFTFNGGMHESLTPRLSFQTLWDSTGGDWATNPWVWVIEFKKVAA